MGARKPAASLPKEPCIDAVTENIPGRPELVERLCGTSGLFEYWVRTNCPSDDNPRHDNYVSYESGGGEQASLGGDAQEATR